MKVMRASTDCLKNCVSEASGRAKGNSEGVKGDSEGGRARVKE